MRTMKSLPWLLVAVSFTVTGIVAAQSDGVPGRIYVIDYMKIEPGQSHSRFIAALDRGAQDLGCGSSESPPVRPRQFPCPVR